jgi:aspartyl protease family protein
MGTLRLFVISMLMLGGFFVYLAGKFDAVPHDAKTRAAAKEKTAAYKPATGGSLNTLAVPRDRSGHFSVNATIAGRQVDFMVDTGASIIALRADDAKRLGIEPAPREYTVMMDTAGGIVRAAPIRLAAVEVGPILVQDVSAVVMPNDKLSTNLLGMTFLSRIRRFEFRTGSLVLEQ